MVSEDLLNRIKQAMRDGVILLGAWNAHAHSCPNCGKLRSDTAPYLKGLQSLVKELDSNG